jgi:hypothetical protein
MENIQSPKCLSLFETPERRFFSLSATKSGERDGERWYN